MFSEKRNSLGLGLAVCLVLGVVTVTIAPPLFTQAPRSQAAQPQVLPITAQAQVGEHLMQLEVARTIPEQARGLMYRTELADDRGMLFPYSPPQSVSFWMKNCLISLDLIFIRQGKIVGIQADTPPCDRDPCPVYPSPGLVDAVIEIRGGRAAELGLAVGDVIKIQPL